MPNGDPHFDLEFQQAWFEPIADTVEAFANSRNLLIDKYYHDAPGWDLRFNHPKGGQASISIHNHTEEMARIGSVWHLDDYEQFTRFLHWRKQREIPKTPESVAAALREEFAAILSVAKGDWNQVAPGYKRIWGRYSKEEFAAIAPDYPDPVLGDEDR